MKDNVDILDDHGKRYDHIDPAKIKLLHDRVLLRELGTPSMVGMIHIPDTANKGGVDEFGYLRIGLVIATGPGDRFLEVGLYPDHSVRRKLLTARCDGCQGVGKALYDFRNLRTVGNPNGVTCPICDGAKVFPVLMPPQCKPGDIVLYSRRREAEFNVNGSRLSLMHAEQSILGVLEGRTALLAIAGMQWPDGEPCFYAPTTICANGDYSFGPAAWTSSGPDWYLMNLLRQYLPNATACPGYGTDPVKFSKVVQFHIENCPAEEA